MNLTQERLDDFERQLKEILEEMKLNQQRDTDKIRMLLSTITSLRATLVMEAK